MSLKIGGHILYVRKERRGKDKPYEPVSYEAILLGQEAAKDGEVGAARLAFFHPERANFMNSSDWHRAFEYAEKVPYKPEGDFFHGYSEPEDSTEALFEQAEKIHELQTTNTALVEQIAQLKATPSAADLDADADEKKAAAQTAGASQD